MVDDAPDPDFASHPPLSDELIADLHAGVLDPAEARRVQAAVDRDPHAQRVLASLDEVVNLLGSRGANHDAGTPVPAPVRRRLDAAVGSQRAPVTDVPVTDVPVPDSLAMRRSRRITAIVAAAAVTALVVLGVGLATGYESDTPSEPVQASGVVVPDSVISAQLVLDTVGESAPGRLADPETLRECLQANGIESGTRVLGSAPVTIDGHASTLLVLPGASAPTVTALVVGDQCGPGDADTVSRADIG